MSVLTLVRFRDSSAPPTRVLTAHDGTSYTLKGCDTGGGSGDGQARREGEAREG